MNDLATALDRDPRDAPLPVRYEAACTALAECQRIDECKEWADKAAALASYARQAEDEELEAMCRRIRLRALDRVGELLRQIEPAHGANQNIGDGGDPNVLTRKQVADEAGLSERQRKTALRINNVPREEFEEAVKSDNPPTASELAKRGIQPRYPPGVDDYLRGRAPEDFQQAIQLLGLVGYIPRHADRIDCAAAIRGLEPHEREQAAGLIHQSMTWLGEALDGLQRR
jgi:hypothetical protein